LLSGIQQDFLELLTGLIFSDDPDLNREPLKKFLPIKFTMAADGHTGVIRDTHKKLKTYLGKQHENRG
jgi:hypothetical protein